MYVLAYVYISFAHSVLHLFSADIVYVCKWYSIFNWLHVGSMPPHSTFLWEEGMCVKSFKLVENGIFQEEG